MGGPPWVYIIPSPDFCRGLAWSHTRPALHVLPAAIMHRQSSLRCAKRETGQNGQKDKASIICNASTVQVRAKGTEACEQTTMLYDSALFSHFLSAVNCSQARRL